MTDEQRLEFAHRIVGCMMPGCNDLALQVIREIEAAEREACAKIAEEMSHCHEIQSIRNKSCGCAWCACAERLAIAIRARGAEGKEK